MATQSFARTLSLSVTPDAAWRTITDVPTLVGWVSLLSEARVVSDMERYTARLEDRIGPFALRADLDIVVIDHVEPQWISIRAEGSDRQVGSRIVVTARVDLHGGATTEFEARGGYEVTGKVATLGSGMIRKKAARVLDEFFENLQRAIG